MRVMCSNIYLRTVNVAALCRLEKRSRNHRADIAEDLGRDDGDLDLSRMARREWMEKRALVSLHIQE